MTNVRRPIHLHIRPVSVLPLSKLPCTPMTPTSAVFRTNLPDSKHAISSNSNANNNNTRFTCSPTTSTTATSSSASKNESLPSQILPHLFVGEQAQTNSETVNKLNIKYILSLGLLPLVSSPKSPTSPRAHSPTETTLKPDPLDTSSPTSSPPTRISATPSLPRATQFQPDQLLPSRNASKDFKINLRVSTATNSLSEAENKGGTKPVRSVHCKCINIADNSEQVLASFFDEAHQFIDEARRKKCNVLIHCAAGISRSPTFAISYLMKMNSLSLQDAFDAVKQCRPQIDPNLSFIGQLMVYEKSLDERHQR